MSETLSKHPLDSSPACEEKERLLEEFLAATALVISLNNRQARAAMVGDPDFGQFEGLIHHAQQKKNQAKYAWMDHIVVHGCWKRPTRSRIAIAE